MKLILISCAIFCGFQFALSARLKIVGGQLAALVQAPYQVALLNPQNSHFCGGAVISDRWILTAAHCIQGKKVSNVGIRVGTNNYKVGGALYASEKFILHESYNALKSSDDIALIKTTRMITFTDEIQSISVSDKIVPDDSTVTLTGWGKLSAAATGPNMLQTIDLKAISYEECLSHYGGDPTITRALLCTFTKEGEGVCTGDSGSPVVYKDQDGKLLLAGVINGGIPCARGIPDIHARISYYYDWIQKKMAEN